MKRLLLLALAALLALCAACSGREPSANIETEAPASPSPTAVVTPEPTPEPTPETTDTPAPTETPDFSSFLPKLGRLIDGPIFPEPFEYLVLHGDSNLHYVFNNMGELLYSFAEPFYEDGTSDAGFFTRDGICCWHKLSTGEKVTPFTLFGDMAITVRAVDEGEEGEDWWTSWHYELAMLRDRALENPVEFGEGEIDFGQLGGILKIEDGYLVVKRSYDFESSYAAVCTAPIIRLDENFNKVGELDPRLFGNIKGVLGGKYVIDVGEHGEMNEDGFFDRKYDVLTLDGETVMENVTLERYDGYSLDDELWEYALVMADYIGGDDGRYYNGSLEQVDELPDQPTDEELCNSPYFYRGLYEYDGYRLWSWGGPYDGVQDENGNWLFRIYSLRFAEDNDNTSWGLHY